MTGAFVIFFIASISVLENTRELGCHGLTLRIKFCTVTAHVK